MTLEQELTTPEGRANPYPIYARLRKTAPVVHYVRNFFGPAWLLTRYEDVLTSFQDPRFVGERRHAGGGKDFVDHWWVPRLLRRVSQSMVSVDEPEHRRLRNLVHQAFTPRRVEQLRATIQQVVDRLLDEASKKPVVDLVADFALPLPMTIISDMMGVPQEDRREIHRRLQSFLDATGLRPIAIVPQIPNMLRLTRFFHKLIRLRRAQPGDDLITALVQAEEAGDRLNEDELLSMIFLLLLAGHETTVNLIANGSLALLENPDQLQKLREHPELIDSAVEELLRYTNPVELPGPRFAREDIPLHGVVIPRGAMVAPCIASANRDETVFPDADALDIARTPNRHLSFGFGMHFCLGAPLARLEGRLALQALVQGFPRLRLAAPASALRWRSSTSVRGLKALPVHLA